MKRLIFIFIIISLTACSQATVEPTTAPTSTPEATATFGNFETQKAAIRTARAEGTLNSTGTPNLTATILALTPSLTPTPSSTPAPTWTSRPTGTKRPTATITPYPTFDPGSVQTRIPSSPAVCPPENPDMELDLDISWETDSRRYDAIIWGALNKGASLRQVAQAFDQALDRTEYFPLLDLTGDNVPELFVSYLFSYYVIGCDNNSYKTIFQNEIWIGAFSPLDIVTVQDMNLNRTPDVVLKNVLRGGHTIADIWEWNGAEFVSVIQANHGYGSTKTSSLARALYWYDDPYRGDNGDRDWNLPGTNTYAKFEILDLDGNGTKELILKDNAPTHWDTVLNFGPWRGQQMIFTWDGLHFLYSNLELDPPQYRFQAVQDADRLFLLGEYDRSLQLYQDVIFSDKLEWWSTEKRIYNLRKYMADQEGSLQPIPIEENTDEYLNLSAYARYRIILHHLARGWLAEAETNYNALLEKFPQEGLAGYGYVQMATILWGEYQKSGNLGQACQSVVGFAEQHPELLEPLGSGIHGQQSHIYEPEDVCPFK